MKPLKKLIVALLSLQGLASCSTPGASLNMTPDEPMGLLMYGSDAGNYFLRKVDVANGVALSKTVVLSSGRDFGAYSLGSGYFAQKLPPGEYAVVSRLVVTAYANVMRTESETCYDTLAPTFRVRAGRIAVWPIFRALVANVAGEPPVEDYLPYALDALKNSPLVSGQPEIAEPVGFVEFSRPKPSALWVPVCGAGLEVKIVPFREP